jgi:hypothetical protein
MDASVERKRAEVSALEAIGWPGCIAADGASRRAHASRMFAPVTAAGHFSVGDSPLGGSPQSEIPVKTA